jgi:hypothetical protein
LEPVVQVTAVFSAAGLIQFIGAQSDLGFEVFGFVFDNGWLLLGGSGVHDWASFGEGTPSERVGSIT